VRRRSFPGATAQGAVAAFLGPSLISVLFIHGF
jgi:hypothetical protein